MVKFPASATRVKVTDPVGKTLWRKKGEVQPTDNVVINAKTGDPYFMYGNPGTPKELPAVPNHDQSAKNINEVRSRRKSHLKKDAVLSTAKKNADSSEVLSRVIEGLAEESAALAFERMEAERRGEKTSQISVRRVNALKAVGDTWLKKKEVISSKSIDLDSKSFGIVFGHIAETFRRACDEAGLRPEMTDTIFAEFGKLVDEQEWKTEAIAKMEGD